MNEYNDTSLNHDSVYHRSYKKNVIRPCLRTLLSQKFSSPLQGHLKKPLPSRHYETIFSAICDHLN